MLIFTSYYHGMKITCGDYFVYKGVKYGRGTVIRFNREFYKRQGRSYDPFDVFHGRVEQFNYFTTVDGKKAWRCDMLNPGEVYVDVDPEKDIYAIVSPVYYYTPKELLKKRLKDGSWFGYIWSQTLFYIFCLLISPLFNQWYQIWIFGTYFYLRIAYITLSRP